MRLRPAATSDVETLFDIRCSVTQNHESRAELKAMGIDCESVCDMIESGDYCTLIAEIDERPAGFAMARISEGYLFACFVREEFEGQGVGKRLLSAVEEILLQAGRQQAWLSTDANPEFRAFGFYRHLGWTRAGDLENGEIRLVKKLSGKR